MDIYCPRCGEPWDADELHEEASARYPVPYYASDEDRRAYRRNPLYDLNAYEAVYNRVRKEFQREGCGTFRSFGVKPCAPTASDRAAAASAMYDMLGSDLDGAAAMLEDSAY